MKSMSDQEFAATETLLRQRLAQLADHAPSAVRLPGEVPVVAANRPARQRRRRAGVIAAVTALVGAGGFTTYSFLGASSDGGAATPEEAVTAFVSAVEHQDVLGMIDVTLPAEVGELRGALDAATTDAKRLDLIGNCFESSGVKGITVAVDDLVLDTNYLEGGLATVTATRGTVNASFDPQTFPFGDKLHATSGGASIGATDPPALLMTVEHDGRWYVSVEYTIAEYARRSAGWEVPGPVTRSPVGFDSPEAAVTGFYDRLGAFDLQGAIDTFAPGEDAMAWLAQSWMPSARAAIDRGRADGWSLAISGLTYETIGSGDHLTLKPITFKAEGTVPPGFESGSANADPSFPTAVTASDGSGYAIVPPGQVPATTAGLTFTAGFPVLNGPYNFTNANPDGTIVPLMFPSASTGNPQPFTIERADGCTTYRGEGVQARLGISSSPLAKPVDGGFQLCGSGEVAGGLGLFAFSGGLSELPAVAVVQSGGKWYTSPLGTALATVTSSLHDAKAGSSLFDSALAPYLYGGMNSTLLSSMITGQPAASIPAACLPALTVENGTVTGVLADPPTDAIRACIADATNISSESSTSTSGGTVTVTPAVVAVATTMVPTEAPLTTSP